MFYCLTVLLHVLQRNMRFTFLLEKRQSYCVLSEGFCIYDNIFFPCMEAKTPVEIGQ